MSKKINIIIDLNINETYNGSKSKKGKNLKNVNEKIDCIDNLADVEINHKNVTYSPTYEKKDVNTEINIRGLNGMNGVKSNKSCHVSYSKSNEIFVKGKNNL